VYVCICVRVCVCLFIWLFVCVCVSPINAITIQLNIAHQFRSTSKRYPSYVPTVAAELGSLAFIPWDTLQLKSQTAIATKKDSLSLHVCRDSANLKVAIDSGTWQVPVSTACLDRMWLTSTLCTEKLGQMLNVFLMSTRYLNIGSLNAAAPLMGASLRLAESTASSMPPPLNGRDTSGGSTSLHPLGQVHLALLRCCVSGRRPARLGGTGGIKMDCNLDYCIRQLSPAHGVVLDTPYQHSDIVPTRNFTAVMAALRQQVADNVRLFGGEADPSSEWTSHVEFLMSQVGLALSLSLYSNSRDSARYPSILSQCFWNAYAIAIYSLVGLVKSQ
jgi:hypothetical protein